MRPALFGVSALSPPFGPRGAHVPALFDEDLHAYLAARLDYPVDPGHIPQGASLPAFTYFQVSDDPTYYLAGPMTGVTTAVYQFDVWSRDYLQACGMSRDLRNALRGFPKLMGSTRVFGVRQRNRLSQYEVNDNGGDDGTYHVALEYAFMYRDLAG